jgi:DNA-binding IclR family transcriptional regulator
MPPIERPKRRIQSVEVGFRIIRALEAADGQLPLKEIAARAGMPASKAYLYLSSYAREGLVQQDEATGHYGLGPFAAQLGLAALRQSDVITLAREELAELRSATRCAAYLSIWGNRGPSIAVKLDGPRQGSLTIRLGYVLPLLHSATGRAFLAHLPESETAPLLALELRRGGNGPHRREVAEIVAAVRRDGYATSENLLNAGFAAMAAPVFDFSGQMAAALTILGPNAEMTAALRPALASALLPAAARLSARLGYMRADAADAGAGARSHGHSGK